MMHDKKKRKKENTYNHHSHCIQNTTEWKETSSVGES